MKHPSDEEWMDYLYDELEPGARRELAAHLEECAECRRQVQEWEAAMSELDAWPAPATPQHRRSVLRRAAPWLAAAAVLVVAFVLGRISAPKPDVHAIRDEVARGLRAEWQADISAAAAAVKAEMKDELRGEMNELALVTLDAANNAAARLVEDYARAFDATRRSDLLALATLTDREFARTKHQLASALAHERAADRQPASTDSPDSNGEGALQ
jgi:hypothetical protein